MSLDNVAKIRTTNKEQVGRPALFTEIGWSGRGRNGIQQEDEFLQTLRGLNGIRIFREMSRNDPVCGGSLLAMEQITRKSTWTVQPPDNPSNLESEATEYVRQVTTDMEHTWDALMSDVTSMYAYGFAFFELVLKLRKGDVRDPKRASKFNDGRFGVRKIQLRRQSSLEDWVVNENGEAQAFIQQSVSKPIPFSKGLLFRTTEMGGDPQGRSVLRRAYRPWFFKRRIEELEAIGTERDLIGFPVLTSPENYNLSSLSSTDRATAISKINKLLYSLRRDERDGLYLPHGWVIKLLAGGGASRRQFDLDKIITRYNKNIAVALLTQAMLLGLDRVGSYNLAEVQDDFFTLSQQGYLDGIAETLNIKFVPKLLRLNPDFAPLIISDRMPKLVPTDITEPTLKDLGAFLREVGGLNIPFSNDDALRIRDTILRRANISAPQLRRVVTDKEHNIDNFSWRLGTNVAFSDPVQEQQNDATDLPGFGQNENVNLDTNLDTNLDEDTDDESED